MKWYTKVFYHFKTGTKLLLRDAWRWANGDMWAWLQFVSALLFILVVYFAEATLINNLLYMWIMLAAFIAFNLFAMWKTFQEESR